MLLIENGTLLSHDGATLAEMIGWLAIDGDRIAALGPGDAPAEWRQGAARVIDARHMAVLPGLVNGHTHLSQTFLRGLADDRPLLRWLKEIIWPAQAAMTPEDQYLAALLGLVENCTLRRHDRGAASQAAGPCARRRGLPGRGPGGHAHGAGTRMA